MPVPDLAVLAADIAHREAQVPNTRDGAEKTILWAGWAEQTEFSVVYVHGFSASRVELSPVPEKLASALSANLFVTRLAGHGTDGVDMGNACLADWDADLDEALSIARRIGRKVVVVGCSTGCTLLVPALARDQSEVAAALFVSPNFALADKIANVLLRAPFARNWVPLLLGRERSFEPHNAAHAAGWTTRYDSRAIVTMMEAVQAAARIDSAQIKVPLLIWADPRDKVVSFSATKAFSERWGGLVQIHRARASEDPNHHVSLGDAVAPVATETEIPALIGLLRGLLGLPRSVE